ncbi:fluoride efflux transporter CrcB [Prescottella equi]|uniref:Fluoride-specific ion channel FluC n=1 Tax=Rhodococcus hoagii TaxID=43767 RepID=A0AAE2W9E5_RHOHA|nr:fluoride efflux transporter CrcB [Prescottella equi]MBM4518395.1 fluoride efflux transporter CrcB [Prescottella equi]MBM4530150.1 fluoride efflux transporter CrcB [Prescottella equi]MBM4533070.1 fluoride efflux transporter CrcB [Prescottella equi]MBM4542765.1 fluoride efflux transporter CrcB [Prescottella equi]MBM4543956.1 fluoride efflux transporter CrcB [Prescottella equi]
MALPAAGASVTVLWVALGGGVGAGVRYLTGRHLTSYGSFPVPTFVVNVVGCFVLGLLSGATLPPAVFALLGTGFCGGLTTYSTFATETVGLARVRRTGTSVVYAASSIAIGIGFAWLGFRITA